MTLYALILAFVVIAVGFIGLVLVILHPASKSDPDAEDCNNAQGYIDDVPVGNHGDDDDVFISSDF